MGKQQNGQERFCFRLVGFREVWSLLDLDRFDEILLEDMRRTDERVELWLIEVYEAVTGETIKRIDANSEKPVPIAKSNNDIHAKSLGKMTVDTARTKFQ